MQAQSYLLSGSEHEIVNGVYTLNGFNILNQPRYTHSSGDYDINYDGKGTWWLNTDKGLSGGAKFYRAVGDEHQPPASGWITDKALATKILLVADENNEANHLKKNAIVLPVVYVSREGTDDIDSNNVIVPKNVAPTVTLNDGKPPVKKTRSTTATNIYNLRIGYYRINSDNSACDFSGESPDPRYNVSTNMGFNLVLNPGDDVNCGWQLFPDKYYLNANATPIITSTATPYTMTINVSAWEEDGCGDDNQYNSSCFNEDDHPLNFNQTTVTFDPNNMNYGYNFMNIEATGNGAQYGIRLEWEMLDNLLVTMYEDANLSGNRQQVFGLGDWDVNSIMSGVKNDNISSMVVASGYKVTAYNNGGFNGYPTVFRGNVNFVEGFNDVISSFKVEIDDFMPNTASQTLAIYFNGSDATLEYDLQNYAPLLVADHMIMIKGIGASNQNYTSYNVDNIAHIEEEVVHSYTGFDFPNPFPTVFVSTAKVFKNNNQTPSIYRHVFGVDMDYDGSAVAGYEDEDSYAAVASVFKVLKRYNLKDYNKILISGHSRGTAVGVSSFLYGLKKAIEGDPQFLEFQGLVNQIFGNANVINVVGLDPVAGSTYYGLTNNYHMGSTFRMREIYSWLKLNLPNIHFSEIYANGARMLEASALGGLGYTLYSNTFVPSPNFLHVEPSNNVHRYWLGYRHSSIAGKAEKLTNLYINANTLTPLQKTAQFLNAGLTNQSLFRDSTYWFNEFRTNDQLGWLSALELYGCDNAPVINDPDADLEITYYHGQRHTTFNNSDASPVNMDNFIGNNNLQFNCSSESFAPKTNGLFQSTNKYTDTAGWTHYCSCKGELLLSLKEGGTGIDVPANNGVTFIENLQSIFIANNTGFITSPNGAALMNRSWNVNPTTQPSNEVPVRFYFKPIDYSNINDTLIAHNQLPLTSLNQLWFYKATSGGAHEVISNIPTANIYTHDLIPSTTKWTLGTTPRNEHYAEFKTTSFSGGGGGGTSGANNPLPIELLAFAGKKEASSNVLSWVTQSEQNNAYFNLQYSTNGIDYTTITTIPSKAMNGNSETSIDYSTRHNTPSLGHNYYRLEQVDINHQKQIASTVIDLIWGANGSTVSCYPNPTSDILNIDLYATKDQHTIIKLLDVIGRVVKHIQVRSLTGMNNIKISMGEIESGIYTIQVYENNTLTHSSLVKKND